MNLSRTAVSDRIRRLEAQGVISGYHAHIKRAEETLVSAYLALTFRPLSCELIQPYIEQIPEIKMAHSISGDVDLMLLVQTDSMRRLHDIRTEMDSWPNISKVVTHMCLANRLDRY